MTSPMDTERFERLVLRYIDGIAGTDELADLNRTLRTRPDLADLFVRIAGTDRLLQGFYEEQSDLAHVRRLPDRETPPIRAKGRQERRRLRTTSAMLSARRTRPGWGRPIALAAAAGVALIVGVVLLRSKPPARHEPAATAPQVEQTPVPAVAEQALRSGPMEPKPRWVAHGQLRVAQVEPAPAQKEAKPSTKRSQHSQSLGVPPVPPVPQHSPARSSLAKGPAPAARAPESPEEGPAGLPEPTERPVARIAKLAGRVMYARGAEGRWVKAVEGVWLLAGDRLDTRTGRARIDLEPEVFVYANQATVLRVLPADTDEGEVLLVDLARGEVFIEDDWQQVHVQTSDGLVSPVGTRFHVARKFSWTRVVVEKGAVWLRAKRTPVDRKKRGGPSAATARKETTRADLRRFSWVEQVLLVKAGEQASLRRGVAPSLPKPVRVEKLSAWTGGLEPPRKVMMRFGLEDRRQPKVWKFGAVVEGPQRPGNRYCLGSTYRKPDRAQAFLLDLDEDRTRFTYFAGAMALAFDCWVSAGTRGLTVHVMNSTQRQYYTIRKLAIPPRRWTRVSIAFTDLVPKKKARGLRFAEKDIIGQIKFIVHKTDPRRDRHYAYLDNVELISYPPDYTMKTRISGD